MQNYDYPKELVDSTHATSATAYANECERAKKIEDGRMERLTAPIQNQTILLMKTIEQHETVIEELRGQNENFKSQITMLQKSEAEAKRKSRYSLVGFVITTIISLASLLVAILK